MEKIRTLGLYQPFASLMLVDKLETRWVIEGRKPPFTLGKYLFYSCKKRCDHATLFNWCGPEIMLNISRALDSEPTRVLDGCAIGIGELINIRHMVKEDEARAYVKFIGTKTEILNGKEVTKRQWVLEFANIQKIEPFMWKHGAQGTPAVPEHEYENIKIPLNP